jgi:Zn-dependent peptidase ImmA (M78 family)/transcriptional regulator with XRE-family HTH domain
MAELVHVQPQVLRWARERAALDRDELATKVGLKVERIAEWETTGAIDVNHLDRVATKTHTPLGYLYLPAPPLERLPITDFRTVGGDAISRPSPDLLATIYRCQQRQDFYRDYLVAEGEDAVGYVGSVSTDDSPIDVAQAIRTKLGLSVQQRADAATFEDALTAIAQRAEDAGILVMRNGIVGNDTHRKLNPSEFRGFALSDEYAPLVFVNAADPKAAQMFTLAHELGHIWLGETGVSDVSITTSRESERFCNAVAAELLVPRNEFISQWRNDAASGQEIGRLARYFKVSVWVMLIRAKDAGVITETEFNALFEAEKARLGGPTATSPGGDFYRTARTRLGGRFIRSVIASTLEGRTPYTRAFRLLDLKRAEPFEELARRFGVRP